MFDSAFPRLRYVSVTQCLGLNLPAPQSTLAIILSYRRWNRKRYANEPQTFTLICRRFGQRYCTTLRKYDRLQLCQNLEAVSSLFTHDSRPLWLALSFCHSIPDLTHTRTSPSIKYKTSETLSHSGARSLFSATCLFPPWRRLFTAQL